MRKLRKPNAALNLNRGPFVAKNSFCPEHPDLLLNDNGVETLGVLHVDGLDVAVELLLGALLVVTAAGDADAETVGNALDTLLPDLLVELGVDADIGGTLKSHTVMSVLVFVQTDHAVSCSPTPIAVSP